MTKTLDTEGLSIQAHVLKRMALGEHITAKQLSTDYGASSSLMAVTVKAYEKRGVKFLSEPVPFGDGSKRMMKAYYLVDGQDVSEFLVPSRRGGRPFKKASKKPAAKKPPAAKKKATVPAKVTDIPKRKFGLDVPPLPPLGSSVRVIGQMLDEDTGNVRLMVKNDDATWLTDVDGIAMSS